MYFVCYFHYHCGISWVSLFIPLFVSGVRDKKLTPSIDTTGLTWPLIGPFDKDSNFYSPLVDNFKIDFSSAKLGAATPLNYLFVCRRNIYNFQRQLYMSNPFHHLFIKQLKCASSWADGTAGVLVTASNKLMMTEPGPPCHGIFIWSYECIFMNEIDSL